MATSAFLYGGQVKPPSLDTLREFTNMRKRLGRHATAKGMSATEILRLSHPDDISRAQHEIHYAVPLSLVQWQLTLRTQASHQYGASHHTITVQLLDTQSMAGLGTVPALTMARQIAQGKVKFDCDCGRHRYWYRYMATVGGWGCGQPEHRFPKETNPSLRGVACKHVVRVARELQSSRAIHNIILKFIERMGKRVEQSAAQVKRTQSAMLKQTKAIDVPRISKAELFATLASKSQAIKHEKPAHPIMQKELAAAIELIKQAAKSGTMNMAQIAKQLGLHHAQRRR